MASYVTIHSPMGEPFEVGEERAAELLLNFGWTRNAPEETNVSGVIDAPSDEVRDAAEENATVERKGRRLR